MSPGTLYLLPVPLAENSVAQVVPPLHHDLVSRLTVYIAENSKTARHWIKAIAPGVTQAALTIHEYGKHTDKTSLAHYFAELAKGEDVGLMSEAGCPAIADPGADIVAEAHRRNIRVCPLVGPSSILLALMASGFNGQSFAFHGYLPIGKEPRAKRLKELESNASRYDQTQLFIETPYRNNQLLEEIVRTCNPQTRLSVAADLTAKEETIISATIAKWKTKKTDLHKRPAIFCLYKAG
ncbi:SAM-dependent methyltransferase [Pedobacter sp. HMF7056]|uniref:SAM-dependent methyltransferase n=2 Tax=Hufsiella ginkgonis TaxID=2695274 RepID=A0A7K1XTT0_9SPHI|nr:SAM-dependent methyltransferase [Hufsiella ginkgonis]MXV14207.1 SAM-dependent methyltransferase [Hufsiella ginkgonis]